MNLTPPLFSVLPRSRSSAALLLAAALMATVATTLVAAVPLYSDAIIEAGLRSTLADAPPAESGLETAFRADAGSWTSVERRLEAVGARRLPGELDTATIGRTDAYALPPELADDQTITAIAALDADRDLLATVAGPRRTGPEAIGAALHVDAAAELGLGLGDRVVLERPRGESVTVEIDELVEPVDPLDEIWFDQALLRDGVTANGTFVETGPFLVDPADFARLGGTGNYRWRVLVEPDSVTTDDLDALRAGVSGFGVAVGDRLDVDDVEVTTDLPAILAATDTAVGSTAAVIAAILLQLVGVALYGVGLSASVLVSSRAPETSMLRSRGATPQQLAAMAAAEAALVALPAVALGPLLGGRVVELVERWGPVSITGLDLRPEQSMLAVGASIAVGVLVVAIVTWPAFRSAKGFAGAQVARARQESRLAVQRAGLDVGVVVLAVLGLWRLSGSAAATSDLAGRLGTDPVLVLAPALGVVAASLVTLRLISFVAVGSERVTATRGRMSLALAGWELARRPGRTARTSVLVVLSVTVGTFAAVHGASWQRSQRDQADAAVSADLVVTPDLRPTATIGPTWLPSAYRALDGVDAVLPVDRVAASFSAAVDGVPLVATDARGLGDHLRLRDDLYGDVAGIGDADAFADLHDPGELGAIELGDVTGDLRIGYELDADPATATGDVGIAATIVDAYGTPVRIEAAPVPVDRPAGEIVVPLTSTTVPGASTAIVGPVRLIELEIAVPAVQDVQFTDDPLPHARFTLDLGDAHVGDRAVTIAGDWEIGETVLGSQLDPGSADLDTSLDDGALRLDLDSGRTLQPRAAFTVDLATGEFGRGEGFDVPAFVTPDVLSATQLEVGDVATVRLTGGSTSVRVAGVVPVVPFAVDEPAAMIVDWASLSADRWSRYRRIDVPDRWALAADADAAGRLARELAGPPFSSDQVAERRQEARNLSRAPVTVGLSGSLALALVASLVVAAVGLILTAVVGARERRPSFAVLRAMGTRAAELRRWLLLETVPLVGLSALAGLAAGIALARLALPSLGVATDGTRAIPAPQLVVPWATLLVIAAIAVAAGMALPFVTARLLRRHRTADELRIGDTT